MPGILVAGFGGQGILFAGKAVAHTGMLDHIEVSWLPSYGPEMRGGTANCSVCLQKEPIGSPLVSHPDWFVVMNQPSYHKFIDNVQQGGLVIYDSTLVEEVKECKGISQMGIPASAMAQQENLTGLANIITVGYLLQKTKFTSYETMQQALKETLPPRKSQLLQANDAALKLGYQYCE